jgi:hypothetical protein
MKMHTNISYKDLGRDEADAKAIADIEEYCGAKFYEVLLAETKVVEDIGTGEAFQQLNIAMAFAGIKGFPIHAWGRRKCLKAYRAWMADGEDGVETDEAGYTVEA